MNNVFNTTSLKVVKAMENFCLKVKIIRLNLPDKEFNTNEKQVLSIEVNFAITSKSVNVLDFIAGIESDTVQLSAESADQFRRDTSTVLKNTKNIIRLI